MDNITQFFTVVSSWAVAITAIVAALSAIFKPFGKLVSKLLGIRKGTNEIKEELGTIKKDIGDLKADVEKLQETGKTRYEELKGVKSDIKEMREDLTERITKVQEENDDNERSRIRRDIMKYGMIARKKDIISEKEFESLRLDYEKYHGPLHGNGIVTEEYRFIVDYYNKNYVNWM